MGKLKNLAKVAGKLKSRKWKRVRAIIRDYGMREFLRRVKEKMRYGDMAKSVYQRISVITNESYIKNPHDPSGFFPEQQVSFTAIPASVNVGRVDILTQSKNTQDTLKMTVKAPNGKTLLETISSEVKDNDYTVFTFLPILRTVNTPLTFTFTASSSESGVLVNRRKKKHGFDVAGGGSVACRIYVQFDAEYLYWMKNNTPTEEEYTAQRSHVFEYAPKVSIIVPLYNTPEHFFREMIDSVVGQTYPNWELCLADGSTEANDLKNIVTSYNDDRIVYKRLETNEGISGNSNRAIAMATGEYVALLDHDDTLMPQALYENISLINKDRDYEFIYSDEDKITEDGSRRFDPFFKPDFAPNMFLAFNYITHFVVMKKSLLDEIGYFNAQFNGAQDYDLFLRATEKAKKVGHIGDILYHWRISETSTAFSSDTKSYTVEAGKKALEAAFVRRGLSNAHVACNTLDNYYITSYDIPAPHPLVSIIIPNKDEPATLKKCIDSILLRSTYDNYEILVVENNSTGQEIFSYYEKLKQQQNIRIITWDGIFNYAAINNFAAQQAKGELLLFLNNDVSIISPDWLEQMVMHAVRSEIGAVGAKLYYPDDTIQHAGVVLKIGAVAGHSHKHLDRWDVGSFGRMTFVQDVAGVTAACLMVRKNVFEEAGGFDEQFVVAFNDVDLCLKIREAGYINLFTPFAELYHYESKTRGYEETPEKIKRFEGEQKKWLAKWDKKYPYDPLYSKNLTREFEDYSVNPNRTRED
ncbi:MAG: glycosyltransferase [Christensenella sp.]|uniref:glycosyltransferase family 2 protein n=1 Tax=Christensenella sp. TaxID=1935934 RepID=UPI002B1FC067|nr:glycosyltransferase [Christensenella sp.]MEA5002433.1 glycosyltransferase [Christensenella sp.]